MKQCANAKCGNLFEPNPRATRERKYCCHNCKNQAYEKRRSAERAEARALARALRKTTPRRKAEKVKGCLNKPLDYYFARVDEIARQAGTPDLYGNGYRLRRHNR